MLVITTKNEIGMTVKCYYNNDNSPTTFFYYKGDEIAHYSDKYSTLYLNSDFIGCNFSDDIRKRAVSRKHKRAYKWLLEHYANSNISEHIYLNIAE